VPPDNPLLYPAWLEQVGQPQQNMKARNSGKARPLLFGDFYIITPTY